jgi:hypothetical protein
VLLLVLVLDLLPSFLKSRRGVEDEDEGEHEDEHDAGTASATSLAAERLLAL